MVSPGGGSTSTVTAASKMWVDELISRTDPKLRWLVLQTMKEDVDGFPMSTADAVLRWFAPSFLDTIDDKKDDEANEARKLVIGLAGEWAGAFSESVWLLCARVMVLQLSMILWPHPKKMGTAFLQLGGMTMLTELSNLPAVANIQSARACVIVRAEIVRCVETLGYLTTGNGLVPGMKQVMAKSEGITCNTGNMSRPAGAPRGIPRGDSEVAQRLPRGGPRGT